MQPEEVKVLSKLIMYLLLCIPSSALAADMPVSGDFTFDAQSSLIAQTQKKKKRKRKKRRRKRRKKASDSTSKAETVSEVNNFKTYGAAVTAGYYQFNLGFGADFIYNWSNSFQLVGQVLSGSNSILSDKPTSQDEDQQSLSYNTLDVGLKVRYFLLWDGFYLGAGASYASISGDNALVDIDSIDYKATALMLKASVGYQEVFNNGLLIGITAGTFSYPASFLSVETSGTSTSDGATPTKTVIPAGEDAKQYVSSLITPYLWPELGMIYVGMLF